MMVFSHGLLHLVKHLAAVKLSRYAKLECTCLQYQLLLNIIGITGMLRSLHREASAERLPRLAEQHLRQLLLKCLCAGGSGASKHQGATGATTPVSTRAASSPTRPPALHSRRHWVGSPSSARWHTLSMLSILRHPVRAEPPPFSTPSPQPPSHNCSQNQLWWTVWSWLRSGHTACFYFKCITVILTALFYSDFKQQETCACLSSLLTRSLNLYLMRWLVFLSVDHCHMPNQMCQAKY